MKKILLLLTILVGSLTHLSAQSLSNIDFVGHWTANDERVSTEIVFWKDKLGDFQMVSWDKSDGEMLEISNLKVINNTLTVTTRNKSTNWVIYRTFILIDENNLKETIKGDTNTKIYWKKLK
ncbi:MAG: hypothetical protein KJ799_14815 [Bacteroidetes bacterium]|nr:hypothetical protein [Bacteroidota bacterium]MBU1680273.1 hypothetical protein [Bacteroidota bacterium]MBU2507977.1 hypothetical protein [Bacteroidota bacterium]